MKLALRSVPNRHIACEAKVLGLENLVRAGVVQNGFRMNSCLMRERTITTITGDETVSQVLPMASLC